MYKIDMFTFRTFKMIYKKLNGNKLKYMRGTKDR